MTGVLRFLCSTSEQTVLSKCSHPFSRQVIWRNIPESLHLHPKSISEMGRNRANSDQMREMRSSFS